MSLTFGLGLDSIEVVSKRGKRFDLDPEYLRMLYWDKGLSVLNIAKKLGFSGRTIHIRMQESGIPLRTPWSPGPNISRFELKRMYLGKRMSSRKIARLYGCAYSTVDRMIRKYEFPVKTLAAAHIFSERKSFSGDLYEKAYLIGFRIGDLRVRKMYKNSETLLIDCASTHPAQIELINSLFSQYGHVWISKPTSTGKVQIQCSVDLSFLFLLQKFEEFPRWTKGKKSIFLSILAGFIDAEGCFYVTSDYKTAKFSIGNYNTRILIQIKDFLEKLGYTVRLFKGVEKGYKGKDGYAHREDYWILGLDRKLEVRAFTEMVLPYLRHREKIEDTERVLDNIEVRNMIHG